MRTNVAEPLSAVVRVTKFAPPLSGAGRPKINGPTSERARTEGRKERRKEAMDACATRNGGSAVSVCVCVCVVSYYNVQDFS